MMEIRKDVFFEQEVTVEVNPEDVLDEMTDAEIKSYYKDRFEHNLHWQMPTKHGVRQRHHPQDHQRDNGPSIILTPK